MATLLAEASVHERPPTNHDSAEFDSALPALLTAPMATSAASLRQGRITGQGEAYFPVMSPAELAQVSVPATASPAEVRRVFEEHGVCLVTGMLGLEECAVMENLWLEDLVQTLDPELASSEVERLRTQGLSAWRAEWETGRSGSGSQRGLPHGGFAWASRLHPRVRRVFATVFDTTEDDMCVGLDNTFWSPADIDAKTSDREWLHVDQNHCTGMTWPCAQGVLYVQPSEGESSSTTVVWPGSHRHVYSEVMSDATAAERGLRFGGQSVRLNQLTDPRRREALLAQAVSGSRRVPCPAGSLLLWDSRTVHQGWSGGPRLAQPVCWEPRERRDEGATLRRKLWMCAAGVSSSHSSSEGRVHGMAPRQPPAPQPAGASQEGAPARVASLVPYGVALGEEAAWNAMQGELWRGGSASKSASVRFDVIAVRALLREEVLAAL